MWAGKLHFLFYGLKWYNCVVMKMDDHKNSDNFQRTEGCKMISPHHFHPTNGDPRIHNTESNRKVGLFK